MYACTCQVVDRFDELLALQRLEDSMIVALSYIALAPFFHEGTKELQHSALRVARMVFSRYEKHREVILEEILRSLEKLPTSRRDLRQFRLSRGGSIQMVSALVMQLIQCGLSTDDSTRPRDGDAPSLSAILDKSAVLRNSYRICEATAELFVRTLIDRFFRKLEDVDGRQLLRNFVQDLLSAFGLPEWPSSELLLFFFAKQFMVMVKPAGDAKRAIDSRMIPTAIELLGEIATGSRKVWLRAQRVLKQDAALSFVPTPKSDAPSPSAAGLAGRDVVEEEKLEMTARHGLALAAYLQYSGEEGDQEANVSLTSCTRLLRGKVMGRLLTFPITLAAALQAARQFIVAQAIRDEHKLALQTVDEEADESAQVALDFRQRSAERRAAAAFGSFHSTLNRNRTPSNMTPDQAIMLTAVLAAERPLCMVCSDQHCAAWSGSVAGSMPF